MIGKIMSKPNKTKLIMETLKIIKLIMDKSTINLK